MARLQFIIITLNNKTMIIILKNADFSGNNVGHVEVPIEVSSETANILNLYGVSELDVDYMKKARALQIFRSDFSKLGILNKVKGLFVPVLAKNTDTAYLNLVSETFDIATVKEQTDELELTSRGIKSIGTTKPLNLNGVFDSLYTDDFHFLQVCGEVEPKLMHYPYTSGQTGTNLSFVKTTAGGGVGYVPGSSFRISGPDAAWVQSSSIPLHKMPVRRLIGISITSESDCFTCFKPERTNNVAGSIKDMKNYAEWKRRQLLSPNISLKGYANVGLQVSVPFLSIGSSLTDEEIIEYDRIVIKMLNTLGTFE